MNWDDSPRGGGVDKASSPRRDHGANNCMVCRRPSPPPLSARLELLDGRHAMSENVLGWFRYCNAHNAILVVIVRARETWWKRDPSRPVGIARGNDTRKKCTQRRLMRQPSPRHAQFDGALADRDGGMGWNGWWVLWRWSGPGLTTSATLEEGSVIWAVLIRS